MRIEEGLDIHSLVTHEVPDIEIQEAEKMLRKWYEEKNGTSCRTISS